MKFLALAGALLAFWLAGMAPLQWVHAEETPGLVSEWGGHIRAIGTLTYPDDQSVYQFTDTDPFVDRQVELRLKHQMFMGARWALETHYEGVRRQGDTLKNNRRLRTLLPAETADRLLTIDTVNDKGRLLNLTRILEDGSDHVVYHRLDRFKLTYTLDRGTLRIGRQALTWGNGLIFNPVDIFNPFAPNAVQRDYKIGEDMLHIQLSRGDSELQLLYLPRRDAASGDIENDQSSFAVKWHLPIRALELDLSTARHFNDTIAGIGATGHLGGAAWRSDLTYTHFDDDTVHDGYWQVLANMDYAWQWGGKNLYGLIEYYYNSLGRDDDYARSFSDPAISQRIARGELFTLGRTYLAGQLQFEPHPLVRTNVTAIVNVADPSAIVQSQILWDAASNFQIILGADLHWGGSDTEFGGFDTAAGNATVKVVPSDSRYLWLTYYF